MREVTRYNNPSTSQSEIDEILSDFYKKSYKKLNKLLCFVKKLL